MAVDCPGSTAKSAMVFVLEGDDTAMDKYRKKYTREENRHVHTVVNMMEVFECFSVSEPELTLTALSRKTGIHKSRLLRICGDLVFKGYLGRDQKTLKYRLGPQLMILGRTYRNTSGLDKLSRPIIRMLAERTRETVSLFVHQGPRRLCLVKEDGDYPIRYVTAEGEILDLHRGAGGMVLLAFLDEEKRRQLMAALAADPATMLPESWMKDHERELREIRRKGYVVSYGKVIPGVAAVAAPVFDFSGTCWASVAIAGPVQRFTAERCQGLLNDLNEATAELSAIMGYQVGRPAAAG